MKTHTQGFVLVCVLWVVAILTLLTVGFGHRAMLDRRAAAYSLDRAEAMMLARGAVHRGILEVQNKAVKDMLKGWNAAQVTYLGQPWAQEKDLVKDQKLFDFGKEKDANANDEVTYIIEDQERFINLNATDMKVMENIKALSRSTQRKIYVRREKGNDEENGPKAFQSPEELRYMRGVDDDDWFGEKEKVGLKELFTVYGDGKININTAPEGVMQALFGKESAAVDRILDYRRGQDGELGTKDDRALVGEGDFPKVGGLANKAREIIKSYCKYNSDYFKITGIATRRNGAVRASCAAVVWVQGSNATILAWEEAPIGS